MLLLPSRRLVEITVDPWTRSYRNLYSRVMHMAVFEPHELVCRRAPA